MDSTKWGGFGLFFFCGGGTVWYKLCCDWQAEGESEVLVAGDPEHRHMAKCDKQGGMRYHPNAIEILVRYRSVAACSLKLICAC